MRSFPRSNPKKALPAFLLVCALLLILGFRPAAAETKVDLEASVFAIVTHKAGIGSGFAHNHLVAATEPTVTLDFDAEKPLETRLTLEATVEKLAFDDPELQKAWYPRVEALGILDEAFKEIEEKERGKIRSSALGKSQLDAEAFPEISARVLEVKEKAAKLGETEMAYEAEVEITIHGKTARKSVPLRMEKGEDGAWILEAAGPLAFSDFGIKAYSAMLGTVKNKDEIHVLVHLVTSSGE